MTKTEQTQDVNLTGIPVAQLEVIEREARRNRRERLPQLRMIIEQAAARIEARERRAAENARIREQFRKDNDMTTGETV